MTTKLMLPKPLFQVELIVEDRKHFYGVTFEGTTYPWGHKEKYPGVTGVLEILSKPALIPWAKKEALMVVEAELQKHLGSPLIITGEYIQQLVRAAKARPDKIKDDAADLGTKVHMFIDDIIHGREPATVPKELAPAVSAFKIWWAASGIELIAGDTKVANPHNRYGGSLDALGYRDGKYIVLDWKTSNGIYKDYALQVSAYVKALYYTYGIKCDEAIIVRFSKNLPIEFEVKTLSNVNDSFDAFQSAQKLQQLMALEHYI